MTPTQINESIARLCGWQKTGDFWSLYLPSQCPIQELRPPNYHADLNAMHEAEMTLNAQQRVDYFENFIPMLWPNDEDTATLWCDEAWKWLTATAAQRAEAFLRVHGKWEE